ncbi:hypothetical protein D3C80_1999300 [compost metagenome]
MLVFLGLIGNQRPDLVYQTMLSGADRQADIAKFSCAAEHLLHALPIDNHWAHGDKYEIKGFLPSLQLNIDVFERLRNNLNLPIS